MPSGFKIHLPFARWPGEDQARWQAAFKSGDRFDESGRGSRLAEATRRNRRESYARFLGFIAACRQDLLNLPPEARVDRTRCDGLCRMAPQILRSLYGRGRSRGAPRCIEADLSRRRLVLAVEDSQAHRRHGNTHSSEISHGDQRASLCARGRAHGSRGPRQRTLTSGCP